MGGGGGGGGGVRVVRRNTKVSFCSRTLTEPGGRGKGVSKENGGTVRLLQNGEQSVHRRDG